MLTRLRLDNFRCFVDFEFKPAQKQLIFGGNGTGKSSLMDALLEVRQFVIEGQAVDASFLSANKTRWLQKPVVHGELEVSLNGLNYVYRLEIDEFGQPPKGRVAVETLHHDGKPIFEFRSGEVQIYNDQSEPTNSYSSDWHRSALATIMPKKDNLLLTGFKLWLSRLFCFRLNPFAMSARAEKDESSPAGSLSNFPAWYRHLRLADETSNSRLNGSLVEAIGGFEALNFQPVGQEVYLLRADFDGQKRFYFNELSEGQRCLICLYTILHFVLSKGGTVVLDEPDNFLALREIQPWLMTASDAVEDSGGQLIIISHHPEIINQWAPAGGVMFVRNEAGPVSVEPFEVNAYTSLTPAELVARGWESE